MLYVQFYQPSATNPKELIEACGDRSVIQVDARLSKDNVRTIAIEECRKRGYKAWRILRGDSLLSAKPASQLWYLHDGRPDDSATSATHGY